MNAMFFRGVSYLWKAVIFEGRLSAVQRVLIQGEPQKVTLSGEACESKIRFFRESFLLSICLSMLSDQALSQAPEPEVVNE
jgi:hypothetical protein